MKLPFRLARGVAVVLAIVATHALIFWLFNSMRLPVPDLGPVFATLMVEPAAKPAAPSQEGQAPVQIITPEDDTSGSQGGQRD